MKTKTLKVIQSVKCRWEVEWEFKEDLNNKKLLMTLEIEVSVAWSWGSKNQNPLMDISKMQDLVVKTEGGSWRGEDNI